MDNIREERKKGIFEYIVSKDYQPVKIKQLAAIIGVPPEDRAEYRTVIDELVAENKISIDSKGRIRPSKDNVIVGKISITQRGFAFVMIEGEDEDIFISESDINGAMNDDKVCVAIKSGRPFRGKRREGRVVSIVERGITKVVGTLDKRHEFGFVISDDVKQRKDLFIPAAKMNGAYHGQKVVALITDYGTGDNRNPEGEIVEILGYPDEKGVDILSIAKAFGLPECFPENVLREAKKMPSYVSEKDSAGRKDLRDIFTITIDGEDAKDLDDAVTLQSDGEGYILGVHIADVAEYVKEGSALDKEALKRGTSAYLVDRVIPMLPTELSNGICSLNQGVDRLALSCIMKMDSHGRVLSHEIAETVINVNYRMSYNQINSIIEGDSEVIAKFEELVPMTELMIELAKKRIKIRKKQGSIDFDFPESKIILDEKGLPVEIKPYERNIATRIIEEFMLVTNETIAEDYFWQEQPFLYRSHEKPDIDKIRELSVFVSNFGLKVKTQGDYVHPMEIQKLLAGISGKDEENLIARLTLRSMKRAKYTVDAEGHFGLASKYYSHFTSPIRRYPDLQIHRIIKENIHGKLNEKRKEHYHAILAQVADNSSTLERRAEETEREVHKFKKAQYMINHIGETYEGIISGVTNWGIYVELPNTIEGMIRLEDMTDDDYRYVEDRFCVIGKYSEKIYALGQKVTISVLRVDLDSRTIDFLIEDGDERAWEKMQ